ncbi:MULTISPECIES: hypothetical protein [Pseudomonas]|uniref:hypothetical protein n=1 Tax=Pseudomonas TaxID=286 RepID=UPI000AB7EDB6|nr:MULTISPECIES: hypothetical protein [Pseudomonas]RMP39858.1 hypothetical protein ALQ23_01426 [Pseudomonas syringae pv. antirrhini]WIN05193.1 hypothetical protein QQF68_16420 [Pseudomonas syringae pv. antirrhini str. 126]
MNSRNTETYWIELHLSGPIEVAKQVIRAECLRQGLCVTIQPTTFVYTGGEESGYTVGLLNYPRFPSTPIDLESRARALMDLLLSATYQHSALMVTPSVTEWITNRQSPTPNPE